jgi:hypothetical protein
VLALAMIVLTALASACGGGSGSGQSTDTTVRVEYAVGVAQPTRAEALAVACPPRARCTVMRSGTRWYLRATMQLRCQPAGGTYADTERACQALAALLRGQQETHFGASCTCPFTAYPSGRIVGTYQGHRLATDLSPCSICGATAAAHQALSVLQQRA